MTQSGVIVLYCYDTRFVDKSEKNQRVRVNCLTSDAVHFAEAIKPYIDRGWKFRGIARSWTEIQAI